MTVTESLTIKINGEPRQVRAGASIAEMLRELGLKAERVADQFRFDARIPHRFVQDDEVATKLGYRIEVIDIES